MRLVDPDKVEKVICEVMQLPKDYVGPSDIKIPVDTVFSILGQVPDAEKQGFWIEEINLYEGWASHYVCSCCDFALYWEDDSLPNYCPDCGCKMNKDEQNGI